MCLLFLWTQDWTSVQLRAKRAAKREYFKWDSIVRLDVNDTALPKQNNWNKAHPIKIRLQSFIACCFTSEHLDQQFESWLWHQKLRPLIAVFNIIQASIDIARPAIYSHWRHLYHLQKQIWYVKHFFLLFCLFVFFQINQKYKQVLKTILPEKPSVDIQY